MSVLKVKGDQVNICKKLFGNIFKSRIVGCMGKSSCKSMIKCIFS